LAPNPDARSGWIVRDVAEGEYLPYGEDPQAQTHFVEAPDFRHWTRAFVDLVSVYQPTRLAGHCCHG